MKTRGTLGLIAGILLLLSSLAHAFLGWPPLRQMLEDAGNDDPQVIGALGAGWLFGSVAMAAFGVIVTSIALGTLQGKRPSTMPAAVIAVAYVLFGLGAFFARGLNPHFIGFVVIGLLAGALAWPTAARS